MELSESELHQATGQYVGLEKALNSWALLHSFDLGELSQEVDFVRVDEADVDIATSPIGTKYWKNLPLPGHQQFLPEDDEGEFVLCIKKALGFIYDNYGQSYSDLFGFLTLIVPVKGPSVRDTITSLSVPEYPFSCFVSKNALFHLAPNVINYEGREFYLAENLFHEMVHNRVNLELLEQEILVEEYDSESSPRIHIEWRKNADPRNNAWQVDRAIHALWVYSYLSKFRSIASKIKPSLFNSAMADQAKSNASYLRQRILDNKVCLTKVGVSYVESSAAFL